MTLTTPEIRNIPPEWKKLFQAAGIKKSELKNKDTAAFVMNIIEQNTGADLRYRRGTYFHFNCF